MFEETLTFIVGNSVERNTKTEKYETAAKKHKSDDKRGKKNYRRDTNGTKTIVKRHNGDEQMQNDHRETR